MVMNSGIGFRVEDAPRAEAEHMAQVWRQRGHVFEIQGRQGPAWIKSEDILSLRMGA